jgi:putative two-component system hydrogenase maturation factor HypX/HoxX
MPAIIGDVIADDHHFVQMTTGLRRQAHRRLAGRRPAAADLLRFADACAILLLTHAFNSLTQRLGAELQARGHEISIEFDIADSVAEGRGAVQAGPDRRALPAPRDSRVDLARHVCLVVHPGIVGDRGPLGAGLGLAGRRGGVGRHRAAGGSRDGCRADLGHGEFPLRAAKKSSIYRNEVTQAAVAAVLAGSEKFVAGGSRRRWRPGRRAAHCGR